MKETRDYFQDITEIRNMMHRSAKFLSISGWSGIMAGIYAIISAYIGYNLLNINTLITTNGINVLSDEEIYYLILLALGTLVLAIGTAIYLSNKRAQKIGEKIWNPTSKRLIIQMAVPLLSGGLFMIFLLLSGNTALLIPLSLVFYGIAIFQAGQFSFREIKILGLLQITLGLISFIHLEYSLLYWAFGFGVLHIIYGLVVHLKYQR
jgi:hypothetical protein